MTPHSSTLAWEIPWTEEPGRLQSMGSLRVRHNWAISLLLFTFAHWKRKWQPTPVFLPGKSQGRWSWWAAIYGVTQSLTWLKWLSRGSSSKTRRTGHLNLLLSLCWLGLNSLHTSLPFSWVFTPAFLLSLFSASAKYPIMFWSLKIYLSIFPYICSAYASVKLFQSNNLCSFSLRNYHIYLITFFLLIFSPFVFLDHCFSPFELL